MEIYKKTYLPVEQTDRPLFLLLPNQAVQASKPGSFRLAPLMRLLESQSLQLDHESMIFLEIEGWKGTWRLSNPSHA